MTIRIGVSAAALLGLAACGGGGGSLGGVATFDQLKSTYNSASSSFNSELGNVPTNIGTRTDQVGYSGFILVSTNLTLPSAPEGYLGQATVLANFAADTVEGSAANFYLVNLDTSTGAPDTMIRQASGDVDFDSAGVTTASFSTNITGFIDTKPILGTLYADINGVNAQVISYSDRSFPTVPVGNVTLDGIAHQVLIIAD